jgi:hypothetical protein
METLYKKIIINNDETKLPKVLHEVQHWSHTRSDRMIKTNVAWTWRVNDIDWYLIESPETEERIRLLEELVKAQTKLIRSIDDLYNIHVALASFGEMDEYSRGYRKLSNTEDIIHYRTEKLRKHVAKLISEIDEIENNKAKG